MRKGEMVKSIGGLGGILCGCCGKGRMRSKSNKRLNRKAARATRRRANANAIREGRANLN